MKDGKYIPKRNLNGELICKCSRKITSLCIAQTEQEAVCLRCHRWRHCNVAFFDSRGVSLHCKTCVRTFRPKAARDEKMHMCGQCRLKEYRAELKAKCKSAVKEEGKASGIKRKRGRPRRQSSGNDEPARPKRARRGRPRKVKQEPAGEEHKTAAAATKEVKQEKRAGTVPQPKTERGRAAARDGHVRPGQDKEAEGAGQGTSQPGSGNVESAKIKKEIFDIIDDNIRASPNKEARPAEGL